MVLTRLTSQRCREGTYNTNLKSKCPKSRRLGGLEAGRACLNLDERQVLQGELRKFGGMVF